METLDYIIIGSGIAGTHTAYRLNQQGKKVLVLEKEPYIGGRMITRDVAGHSVDWGAKFIANFYKHMLPLAKELGIRPIPKVLTTFSIRRDGKFYSLDITRKIAFLFWKGISFKAKLRLIFTVLYLMIKYRRLDYYHMESALHLDNQSTYDDFRSIVGEEAFDYLVEPFSQNVVFYGTKDFSRAAFYSYIFTTLRLKTYSFPEGIGQLCQKMAQALSVELSTSVKTIRRTTDGVEVIALNNGKEAIYQAKAVILAVPGNHVLSILDNPLSEEKEFFSGIRYAGTVQIVGTTKTDLHYEGNFIWTVPKENPDFSALAFRPWNTDDTDTTFFHIAMKEKAYKRLMESDSFNTSTIEQLIQQEFPRLTQVKITGMQIWESATPIMYPGYMESVINFMNRPDQNTGIYFCGDYLENPSTEGALTSSIKLLAKIST
jgi:protoporphyrinogen oxidase